MADTRVYTVAQIAAWCDGRLPPDIELASVQIHGVETLARADATHLSWIAGDGHERALAATGAGAILGRERHVGSHPRGIVVDDPEEALARALEHFGIPQVQPNGIHPTAIVEAGATLGANVALGAHAVIGAASSIGDRSIIHSGAIVGASVRIGRDCVLHPGCVVYDRCELGDRVILHAGVVIGADGFGYIFRDGRHRKVPQIGNVVIEDDVEIGANSCVDRAKVGSTRIGRGSKIDNLVQVAHNVQLGQACILVAQVGIAGSTTLGNGVVAAGQAGIIDGLTIGDRVVITAQSAVMKDISAGQVVSGTPCRERTEYLRTEARVSRLATLYEQVAELKKRVAELERTANDRPPD